MTDYTKHADETVDQWLERTSIEYLGTRSAGVPPEVYYRALADTITTARRFYLAGTIKPS